MVTDEGAERAVLATLLLSSSHLDEVKALLTESDFSADAHQLIFRAILGVDSSGSAVDVTTVSSYLRSHSLWERVESVRIFEILDSTAVVGNVVDYARTVASIALQRRITQIAREAAAVGAQPMPAPREWAMKVEGKIAQTLEGRSELGAPRTLGEASAAVLLDLQDRIKNGHKMKGAPCGLSELDESIAGWEPGFYVVAGRPGMGKSSFVRRVGLGHAEATGRLTVTISVEMPEDQVASCYLSAAARVPLNQIRLGSVQHEDLSALMAAQRHLAKLPLAIAYRPGATVSQVRSVVKRALREQRARLDNPDLQLGMIVVDYLQIMSGDTRGTRETEVSSISRGLMQIAGEFRVPLIGASQLNRDLEKREDKRPRLSDLRESGSIEQDAACVLMLYRDDYYHQNSREPGVAEVIIAKQRNGPSGTIKMAFRGELTSFDNVVPSYEFPPMESF